VSDEQHIAMPHLYGGPAYSRPSRPVEEIVRPFDPDELPLEADRPAGDGAFTSALAGATWAASAAPPTKPKRARRSRAAKAGTTGATADAPAGPVQPGPVAATPRKRATGGLQGRPFSLRGLSRIFGGDRK
jgi:hypothetical protein